MNNVANINDVSNSVKATPSILHCGTPVITTGIMAKLYGTDEANVKMNFSRNADRFIEGKHYFKLEGVELKGFKDRVTESYPVKFHDQIVGKRARSLTLWTERGAARHAKMLDTDQAWDVFEALEDFYFTKKDNSQRKAKQIAGRITSEQQEAIKQLVLNRGKALPKEKQAKAMITMWSSLKSHFGCTYKEIDSDKFTEALSLAARVPLEGEYLPKDDPRETTHHYVNKDRDIHNINALAKHYEAIYTAWKVEIYPALRSIDSPVAPRLYDRFKDGYSFLRMLQESLNGKHPVLIK